MDHEDGYCDVCGADMRDFVAQLTIDGRAICITCATDQSRAAQQGPRRPEARDDGR